MPKLRKNAIRNKVTLEAQTRNREIVQTVDRERIHHKLELIAFVCPAMNMRLIIQHLTPLVRYKNGILRIVLIPRFVIGLVDV